MEEFNPIPEFKESEVEITEIKEESKKAVDFLRKKNILVYLPYILLVAIIWLGTYIRTRNLGLLKDVTTGSYLPLALDPFYFLRLGQVLLENNSLWAYPGLDMMRAVPFGAKYIFELLPRFLVWMYKFFNIFSNVSFEFVNVISPVIFFALGMIAFFFLVKKLTNAKVAVISSAFLSVIPLYLYRTMAGFSDHESPGMLFFYLTILAFACIFSIKNNWKYVMAVVAGFLTAITYGAWGGLLKYIVIMLPLVFIFAYFLRKLNVKNKISYLIYTLTSIVFLSLLFSYDLSNFLSSTFILVPFSFGLILFDLILFKGLKINEKIKYNIPKEVINLILLLIVGLIVILVFSPGLITEAIYKLQNPFGEARLSVTVAENRAPYFNDWLSQIGGGVPGLIFFWLFFIGMVALFYKGIKHFSKNKFYLLVSFIIFISGIIFSKYKQGSILNGENILSQVVYFGAILIFFGYLGYLYFSSYYRDKKTFEEFKKIGINWLIIISWLIITIISVRGALRLFFLTAPFVCFAAGFFIIKSFEYLKTKDELVKMLATILLIFVLIGSIFNFWVFTQGTLNQAKNTGPSANQQWQKAMAWIRNNTEEDAVFSHWWDYGYWVQTLGERATVTDGGHPSANSDYLLGRYLLTGQNETEALEFLKVRQADYVLIDPTDIGKYPAYSSIGSDAEMDRLGFIATFVMQESQTQETQNETRYVYSGNSVLDEDLIVNGKLFAGRDEKGNPYTGVGAVILPIQDKGETIGLNQPEIVIGTNTMQERVKMRYVYLNQKIYDFGDGVESALYIIPHIQNGRVNNLGAGLYLSERALRTQWVRMYLLNETENFDLVHSEQDPTVESLRNQGFDVPDIISFSGVRGPIKIWEIDYPSDLEITEELEQKHLGKWDSYY